MKHKLIISDGLVGDVSCVRYFSCACHVLLIISQLFLLYTFITGIHIH